jgi:hypothetical protein
MPILNRSQKSKSSRIFAASAFNSAKVYFFCLILSRMVRYSLCIAFCFIRSCISLSMNAFSR